jgi:hypothetical protein
MLNKSIFLVVMDASPDRTYRDTHTKKREDNL